MPSPKMSAPSAPFLHAGAGGLVSFFAVGIIGIVAGLRAYDIYLKVKGIKNWDGTPKIARPHHHRAA